jgi:hypothetical protein
VPRLFIDPPEYWRVYKREAAVAAATKLREEVVGLVYKAEA